MLWPSFHWSDVQGSVALYVFDSCVRPGDFTEECWVGHVCGINTGVFYVYLVDSANCKLDSIVISDFLNK